MTYLKRLDKTPDCRAIADMGGGVEARIERIIETTGDGVVVLLPNGEQATARRIIKPEMTGMVVQLDTGELVQVEYLIKAVSDSMTPCIHVLATWVDEDLDAIPGDGKRPVTVEFKFNASHAQQDAITLPVIVRECLMLVLGEPLTLIQAPGGEVGDLVTLIAWDVELVRSVDIRRAIRIASESTDVDLGVLL